MLFHKRFYFLILICAAFSSTQSQNLIHSRSWLKRALEEQAVMQGAALLNHTYPLTPHEVENLVVPSAFEKSFPFLSELGFRRIDIMPFLTAVPMKSILLRPPLTEDSSGVADIHGSAAFETIFRDKLENPYQTRYEDRQPLINFEGSGRINNLITASVFSVWQNKWPVYDLDVNDTNVPKKILLDLDLRNFHKAYLFFDFGAVTLEAGRDNAFWGNGERGSLILSDNVPYFDMVRLGAVGKKWKVHSLFAQLNDYSGYSSASNFVPIEKLFNPPKTMFAHRIECIPLDFLSIALSELTIIYGRDPTFADVNPLIIQHNLFRDDHENSIAGLDISLYPFSGFSIYGEWGVDDMNLGKTSADDKDRPTSQSLLLGSRAISSGLVFTVEYVLMDKWFYNYTKEYGHYGRPLELDEVNYTPESGIFKDDVYPRPIGHWLPPDSRTLYVSVGTLAASEYQLKGSAEFRRHGEVDLSTQYLDSVYLHQESPTGVIENMVALSIEAAGSTGNVFAKCGITYCDIKNFLNREGIRRSGFEFELAVGVIY